MRRNWWVVVLVAVISGMVGATLWLQRRFRATYPDAMELLRAPSVDAVVERMPDDSLRIHWEREAPQTYIYGGHKPDSFASEPLHTGYNQTMAELDPAVVNDYRYFQLELTGGAHDGERMVVAERELPLEGAVNFRDIGGYRTRDGRYVRWNRVYRAGQLSHLTPKDLADLSALGVSVVCDLRSDEEVADEPDVLGEDMTYQHIPVRSDQSRRRQIWRLLTSQGEMEQFMRQAYIEVIVDRNPDVYARIFELIADVESLPLVVHCTAGKDRTGVGMALLLAHLGVPDEVILADYSLSNRHFDSFVSAGEKAIQSVARLGLSVERMLPLFTANPKTMAETLAHVRNRYGSVQGYLRDAGGVSEETLQRVRENLLR